MNEIINGFEEHKSGYSYVKNNAALISGLIATNYEYSHDVFGEGFYKFNIETRRLSGSVDILPVTFSERICDISTLKVNAPLEITGQIRSYNNYSESKNRLILTVFAKDIAILPNTPDKDKNEINLHGFVCRTPVFRTTPFGREIADILLAVNRAYNKSDYIPLIAWGRNARYGGSFSVGDNISVWGRMQSREYQKKNEDGTVTDRIAYEVSISKLEKIDDESATKD